MGSRSTCVATAGWGRLQSGTTRSLELRGGGGHGCSITTCQEPGMKREQMPGTG